MIHILTGNVTKTPKLLVEKLKEAGLQARSLKPAEGKRVRTNEGDLVINYGIERDISVTNADVTWWNKETHSNKWFQYNMLRRAGVMTPKTVRGTDNWEEARKIFDACRAIVVKPQRGFGGKDISKEATWGSAQGRVALLGRDKVIMQQPIDKSSEFRAHVVGDEVVSLVRKKPEDEEKFIWNHTAGAVQHEFKVKLLRAILVPLAVNAVKAMDYHFGAVDIVMAKDGRCYVLEVNSAPGLSIRLDEYAEAIAKEIQKEG